MADDRYYLRFKGRVLGPFNKEKALDMVKRGQITRQHELSPDGTHWSLAEKYDEFFPATLAKPLAAAVETKPTLEVGNQSNPTEWYAHFDGANQGPVEESGIRALVAAGKISESTLVWKAGMANWLEAELVRPEWFPKKPSQRAPSGMSRDTTEVFDDAFIAEITASAAKSRGWMLFLGIFGIVFSTLGAIGSSLMFVSAISSPGSGPAKAMPAVSALLLVVSWIACQYISVLMIRVTSRLQVLQLKPSSPALLETFVAYHRFWMFLGIFIQVWLVMMLFVIAVAVASGVSIFSSVSSSN